MDIIFMQFVTNETFFLSVFFIFFIKYFCNNYILQKLVSDLFYYTKEFFVLILVILFLFVYLFKYIFIVLG